MGLISRIYKDRHKKRASLKRQALAETRELACVLGEKFGAGRVLLFGSLAEKKGHFDAASDIDLAVEGLGGRFFRAYGYCMRLGKFNLDLRPYEDMPEYFKIRIEEEGDLLYEKGRS